MYKLLSALFLILLTAGALAKSFELSLYNDGYYLHYEFPRFGNNAWFEVTMGKRRGLAGVVDQVKNKASK